MKKKFKFLWAHLIQNFPNPESVVFNFFVCVSCHYRQKQFLKKNSNFFWYIWPKIFSTWKLLSLPLNFLCLFHMSVSHDKFDPQMLQPDHCIHLLCPLSKKNSFLFTKELSCFISPVIPLA